MFGLLTSEKGLNLIEYLIDGITLGGNTSGNIQLPPLDTIHKDYLLIVRATNPAWSKVCMLSPNESRTNYWLHTIYSNNDELQLSTSGNVLTIRNASPYGLQYLVYLVALHR